MMKKVLYTALAISVLGTSALAVKVYAHSDERQAKRVTKMFERFDANGDSMISMEEFLVKPQERFKNADSNNDGFVSLAEAQENIKMLKGKGHHKKHRKGYDDDKTVTPAE